MLIKGTNEMLQAKQGSSKNLNQTERPETMLPRHSGQIPELTNRMLVYYHYVLSYE